MRIAICDDEEPIRRQIRELSLCADTGSSIAEFATGDMLGVSIFSEVNVTQNEVLRKKFFSVPFLTRKGTRKTGNTQSEKY